MERHSREHVTTRLRLRGHDYASAGSYFVTICTQGRAHVFGRVHNGQMHLSVAGAMVDSWLHAVPSQFPGVEIDASTVMPNHPHAVVHLGADPGLDVPRLSRVIQWFKIRSTNDYILGVKRFGFPPFEAKMWQSGFYDHFIQSERSLDSIRRYIRGNPANWDEDEYFGANGDDCPDI